MKKSAKAEEFSKEDLDKWTIESKKEDQDYRQKIAEWSRDVEIGYGKEMMDRQGQILNWVFTVNISGIAGAATLLAKELPVFGYKISLGCFAFGLLFNLLYGTLMFKFCKGRYDKFKDLSYDFFVLEMPTRDLIFKSKRISNFSWWGELTSWAAGLLAVAGLISAVLSCYFS